jgi:hypothetical protein
MCSHTYKLFYCLMDEFIDNSLEEWYHELKDLKQNKEVNLKVNYPHLYNLLIVADNYFERKKQQSKINETTQQKEYAAS